MNKNLFVVVCFILLSVSSLAQNHQQDQILYDSAIKLYEQKEVKKAIEGFEKVITLNPRHKDAIFNLSVINLEMGNKDKAIDLLQTAVKLKDRKAADILKEHLQQKIIYFDTMFIEDVDYKPFLLIDSKKEEFTSNKVFPKIIMESIEVGLRKSKVLRKVVDPGRLIVLSIYINKKGELDAIVRGKNIDKMVQEEISKITRSINTITPAKHEGREVVVWGWTMPIRM